MMHYTRVLIAAALIAACAADVFSADKLLLRYSFDSLPPTDEGASKRGAATTAAGSAPTTATGKVNGAASFNPTVSATAIDLYFVPGLILAAPLTFTAWFSIDGDVLANSDLYMKILSQKTQYNDAQGIEVQYNPGKTQWNVILPGDTQQLLFTVPNQYVADSLHHVAVTVSATAANLYLDGVFAQTLAVTTPLTGNTGKLLTIGGSATGDTPNRGGEWHGIIDELRIYNFALSEDEIEIVFSNSDLLATTTTSDALTTTSIDITSSSDPATTELSTTDLASTTNPEESTEPSTSPVTTPPTTQNSASTAVPTLVLLAVAVMAMVL